MWFQGHPFPEKRVIYKQPFQPSVDQVIEPMQYLVNPNLPLESDLYQVIEPM